VSESAVIYQSGKVVITAGLAQFGGMSIATPTISGVHIEGDSVAGTIGMIGVGILFGVVGVVGLNVGGPAAIIGGLALLVPAAAIIRLLTAPNKLVVQTPSGNQVVMSSRNKTKLITARDAVVQAISMRAG